jgi:predicted short-subunit dehydrogenase-like oxidoreductase (DUF2520 family)
VARLARSGVELDDGGDLVILCVPDSAIAEVAQRIAPGPWIAHVSGTMPLDCLAPHVRRFSLHPLQTFNRTGDPSQFDGAWAAISAQGDEARAHALGLAEILGLRPFQLADGNRPLYHAAAVIASNYLVTLYRASASLLTRVGVPPEALAPLMRRTIENGFDLTGPVARGDWETVERHLAALRASAPELEELYSVLATATATLPAP